MLDLNENLDLDSRTKQKAKVSHANFPPAKCINTVRSRFPDVERSRRGPRNTLTCVDVRATNVDGGYYQ